MRNPSALLTTEDIAFFLREIMDDHSSASDDGDMLEPGDKDGGEVYLAHDEFKSHRILESKMADASLKQGRTLAKNMKRELFAMNSELNIGAE